MSKVLIVDDEQSDVDLMTAYLDDHVDEIRGVTDPRQAENVARRLRSSGYNTLSTVEIIKGINVLFLVLECFMGAIGAIGLVVSLFGIANTMAMATPETCTSPRARAGPTERQALGRDRLDFDPAPERDSTPDPCRGV